MKMIRKTAASLFLASLSAMFAGAAQAELMYHVTFSDIEDALMPAVPFPSESALKALAGETGEAPASLGLAPATQAQNDESVQTPAVTPLRKRPLSASETSDLLLR